MLSTTTTTSESCKTPTGSSKQGKRGLQISRSTQSMSTCPSTHTRKVSGKAPVPVGRLDILKGDEGEPEYRSRFVAK